MANVFVQLLMVFILFSVAIQCVNESLYLAYNSIVNSTLYRRCLGNQPKGQMIDTLLFAGTCTFTVDHKNHKNLPHCNQKP